MTCPPCAKQRRSGAQQSKQKTLGEELAHDARAGSADGHAHGEFARARRAAGQQQVGDIRTGDEQNKTGEGDKNLQWQRELIAQAGKSAGSRCQLDVRLLKVGQVFHGGRLAEVLTADVLLEEQVCIGRCLG